MTNPITVSTLMINPTTAAKESQEKLEEGLDQPGALFYRWWKMV